MGQMGTFSKFQDCTKIVTTKANQHNYKIIARKHLIPRLDQIVCCLAMANEQSGS